MSDETNENSPFTIHNSPLRKGYKQTDVGIIPKDWKLIKLGEVFDFKNGLNKEKHYFGQGTPIVNYMDVFKYRGLTVKDIKGKVTVTNSEISNYNVRKDDVFFTRTSETVDEIGTASVIIEDLQNTVFSGFILRARPKNNWLDTFYKKYCFSSESIRKEITSTSSYTTRALTNGRLLSEVKIPLPPLAEQQAIAEVLSDVDALITRLDQLITKKRNIKQGTMQRLLTGKKRLPNFSGDWEGIELRNESELITKGTTPTSIGKDFKDTGINFIKIESLAENGDIVKDKVAFIDRETNIILKRSQLKENDILVSIAGALGRIALVNSDLLPANTNQALAIVRLKENAKLDYVYLFYYLNTSIIKKHIEAINVQGAQANLSLENINDFIIGFPSLAEQKAIAQILSDMDAEIEALKAKRDKYQAVKQGMMQELLTGKIRLI